MAHTLETPLAMYTEVDHLFWAVLALETAELQR
jgi:hypothetical protein